MLLFYKAAPPTILNSGTKNHLTKAHVQLAPFLDQTSTKLIKVLHRKNLPGFSQNNMISFSFSTQIFLFQIDFLCGHTFLLAAN